MENAQRGPSPEPCAPDASVHATESSRAETFQTDDRMSQVGEYDATTSQNQQSLQHANDNADRDAFQTLPVPLDSLLDLQNVTNADTFARAHEYNFRQTYRTSFREWRCEIMTAGKIAANDPPKSRALVAEYVLITDLRQPQQSLAIQKVLREGHVDEEQVKGLYEGYLEKLNEKKILLEEECSGLGCKGATTRAMVQVRAIHWVLSACEDWFRKRSVDFVKKEWWTYKRIYRKRWAGKAQRGWRGIRPDEVVDNRHRRGRLSDEEQLRMIKQALRMELKAKEERKLSSSSDMSWKRDCPVTAEELLGED